MALRVMTNRSLLVYFNKYNRKYHRGRLKLHRIRFVSGKSKLLHDCLGRTICFDLVSPKGCILKKNVESNIIINSRFKDVPVIVLTTLHHEMNHMAHPRAKNCKKSPTFERGMLDLARRGALKKLW